MPNLHAHYHHGNVKQFRQELDGTAGQGVGAGASGSRTGAPLSVSGGKSWSLSGFTSAPVGKGDPNERDAFGRTVLHLAASSLAPQAYTFFGILLRNPQISVNLQDYESGYTALHRALFAGNIRAARDLLARNDIDLGVKDSEGLTAFELYNGTVDGTSPPPPQGDKGEVGTDLFVWGVNRNFALGTGDSNDKAYPDHVNLLTQSQAAGKADPVQRFFHVGVKDVVMSKFHTGVITDEARGNLSICGFGSNGRLGRSVHSQLALLPMPDLPHTITSIALAQDHTLALTSGGYILSWGHNRFAQLGYVFDAPEKPTMGLGKDEVEVQVSPRRIVGPLKKEYVRGVAAGRMASACWTADAVWTWGTNAGHLGYDKAANPVQILPRKVTVITQTVIDVALSDFAMICLLDTNEVLCFHHDANFKISFQVPRVLSDISSFRPAESRIRPMITKITSSGQTFAALSSIGDVFTFSLPNPLEDVSKDARDRHVTVKPQLIWALRKRFDAVRDVAIGSDGTVIISTSSGHVFVRQRVKSGSGQLKFRRIPYLQRVIKVACNESGAFAAIRVDGKPRSIDLKGRTLVEDLALLQPHMQRLEHQMTADDFARLNGIKPCAGEDEEEETFPERSVKHDIATATRLCTVLRRWGTSDEDTLFSWSEPLVGSDVHLVVYDYAIPAHSTILKLRSPAFDRIISGKKVDRFTYDASSRRLQMIASHPLVALLLLQYVYSDEIACIWDPRVVRVLQYKFADLKLPIGDIKSDLRALADILGFSPLAAVLQVITKIPMPKKVLSHDLGSFFTRASGTAASIGNGHPDPTEKDCDVTLVLADTQVSCSSVILRSRCQFFEAMFADGEWVKSRGGAEGKVVVDMSHLRWRPMKLVFRWIHEGKEDDLFDYLHQETMDEFLDFVFEVLAAATELLIDRLVLVCSRVIIRHCNAYNAAALAVEASFYQATTLKESIFDYISSCLETMLESGLLDDMDEDVLQDLCDDIANKQSVKMPVARQQILVKPLMAKHKDWLAVQDIPVPRVRQPIRWKPRSPALSPVDLTTPAKRRDTQKDRRVSPSPILSPVATPTTAQDDIFAMDEESTSPSASGSQTPRTRPMTPLDITGGSFGRQGGAVWKSRTVEAEKVDLRSIMAETAATKTPTRPAMMSTPSGLPNRQTPTAGHRSPSLLPLSTPSKAGPPRTVPPAAGSSPAAGGPWRPVEARRTSLATVQTQQSALASPPAPATAPLLTRAPGSQASPAPLGSGASRVITPAKIPYVPSTTRKASGSGAAWAMVPSFASPPLPPPTQASPGSVGQALSLLAIQQQEQEHLDRSNQKRPAKSFAEIQEEEQRAEAARAKKREEEDFARWWTEEQARLSKDAGGDGRGKGRGRGQKRVPHGGRGRARGGTAAAVQENGHEEVGGGNAAAQRGGRGGKSKASPTTRRPAQQQQQQTQTSREGQAQHQQSSNNQVASAPRA